jgi:hypothetical protein
MLGAVLCQSVEERSHTRITEFSVFNGLGAAVPFHDAIGHFASPLSERRGDFRRTEVAQRETTATYAAAQFVSEISVLDGGC